MMIDHESGHELALKHRLEKPRVERFTPAIERLPPELQTIASAIVQRLFDSRTADEKGDWRAIYGLPFDQLAAIFEVFFDGHASSALATWQTIGTGPYRLKDMSAPFRSSSKRDVLRSFQMDWLSDLLTYFLLFPEEMMEPEGLAVWAPLLDALDAEPTSLYQLCVNSQSLSAHFGLWLGQCMDQGGELGAKIIETFQRIMAGQHPASIFGRQVIYACWSSQQPECWQWMCDQLRANKDKPLVQASIAAAAFIAKPAAQLKLLQCIRSDSKLNNKQIGAALLGWFGWEDDRYKSKQFAKMLDQTIAALERSLSPTPVPAVTDEEKLGDAWVCLTREVSSAVPLFLELLKSPTVAIRNAVIDLAMTVEDKCMVPVLEAGLQDEDPELVLLSLTAWLTHLPKNLEKSERSRCFHVVADICRRVHVHKAARPDLFKNFFYVAVGAGISQLWSDESLSIFGPAIRDRKFDLDDRAPKGYVPPDDFTIDALLCHIKLQDDPLADMLRSMPLKSDQWAELFLKKPTYRSSEMDYIKAFERQGVEVFNAAIGGTLIHHQEKVRAAAMRILLAANESTQLRDAATQLARQFVNETPASTVTEQEARLRQDLRRTYATDQLDTTSEASSTATSSKWISVRDLANYPGLTMTPPWQPVYKQLQRLTPSCIELMRSLDEFIEQHKNRLLREKPDTPETAHIVLLQQWNSAHWTESVKQTWLSWWNDSGQTRAAPADLARLTTLWLPILQLQKVPVPEEIDLSLLRALETYREYDVYPRPDVPANPLPDNEEVRFLRSLKNRHVMMEVFNFLFDRVGSWADVEFLMDMYDSIHAATSPKLRDFLKAYRPNNWFDCIPVRHWRRYPKFLKEMPPAEISRRIFVSANRSTTECMRAYAEGVATLGDIVHSIVCLADTSPSEVISYELVAYIRSSKELGEAWDRFFDFMTDALIEAELSRPAQQLTEWSGIAHGIGYLEGYHRFERLLLLLAEQGFENPSSTLTNLRSQWTTLATSIFPEPKCDLGQVAARLKQLLDSQAVTREHLIRAALLAPQWSEPIGQALNWPGLHRVVEWLNSNANIRNHIPPIDVAIWLSTGNREARERQAAQGYRSFNLYTWFEGWRKVRGVNLVGPYYESLDVHWFREIEHEASESQWKLLMEAGRLLQPPKDAGQFEKLVDALRGQSDRNALLAEVQNAKRPVDLRPLAVYPYAKDASANLDLIERYRAFTEYRKRCRRFSDSQTILERVDYALEILAYCAGAKDLSGLKWKVELAAADQFESQRTFSSDDIEVTLVVDESGTPGNRITKAGKVVKSIPAAIKQDPRLVAQQELLKALKKFATQSRMFLEVALVQKQLFSLNQLEDMAAHPILGKVLEPMLFTESRHIGLFDRQAKTLVTRDGSSIELAPEASLRLIHPVDLVEHGGWIAWRDWLQRQGMTQSVPQIERGVFLREYFAYEQSDSTASTKEEYLFGYRSSDDKLYAELKKRGWTNNGDESSWSKDLDHSRSMGHIELYGFSVSGLGFSKLRNTLYEHCDSSLIDPIDFSECARDACLSAQASSNPDYYQRPGSTMTQASKAIAQHLSARQYGNVRLDGDQVFIDGQIGTYVIDVLATEIRMLPGQYVPFQAFAPLRLPAVLAAIDQLAAAESERAALSRIKIYT